MDSNIYYSPAAFGLETFAEIDYSDGNYQFDYRVVWRRLSDGKLLSSRDSGCSCPSPFENVAVKDLQEVESANWLKEEIATDGREYPSAAEAADFIAKIEQYLANPPRITSFKVVRTVNGAKEYLTADLDPIEMKMKHYFAPKACSYTFTAEDAQRLAEQYKGEVERIDG